MGGSTACLPERSSSCPSRGPPSLHDGDHASTAACRGDRRVANVILRSRLIAPLIVAVAALVFVQYARIWIDAQPLARTSDFAGTYAAATLWREGHSTELYSPAAEEGVLAQTGTPVSHLDIPFENPPAAAVVAAPFSVLDSATAYRVWAWLQLALVIAAVVIVARAAPWPERTSRWVKAAIGATALVGFGTAALWVEGQWDGLSVLGLALMYAGWRADRRLLAGLALGVTSAIAKPHLVVGLIAFVAVRRDWRVLAGAAGGAAGTVLVSLATVGSAGVTAFASVVFTPAYSPATQMQSANGLFGSWLGPTQAAYLLASLAALVAVAAASALAVWTRRRSDLFEPALAGAVALSLFASPHLLSHDLTMLAPALVFGLAWLAREESWRGSPWPGPASLTVIASWVAVSLASQRDLGNSTLAPPGRLTPLALLVLAALWGAIARRERAAPLLRSGVMHVPHHAA